MTNSATHKDMFVWTRAMELTVAVYQLTRNLPASERYGLQAQMRRAAVSVPSNIAEGAARGSTVEFIRFLIIARGSLAELETQVMLCARLGFTKEAPGILREMRTIRRMLAALTHSLNERKLKARSLADH